MLYIESPYGIYQTVDWVAQAQLCTVVGPERFLMLKKHNVRTIFDLERMVLGLDAPSGVKLMIGALLLATDEALEKARDELKIGYFSIGNKPFAAGLVKWMDAEAVEHIVRVMIDDLHVHRLRQIWLHIGEQLGGAQTDRLADTKPPGSFIEPCSTCQDIRLRARRPLIPSRTPSEADPRSGDDAPDRRASNGAGGLDRAGAPAAG
jgi:hypothetical protein